MAWFILILAGLFEVGWAISLKFSYGFTKIGASTTTLVLMAVSVVFLGIAIRDLPLGTAYAIWTGIGTVGTVLLGIVYFDESASVIRLFLFH